MLVLPINEPRLALTPEAEWTCFEARTIYARSKLRNRQLMSYRQRSRKIFALHAFRTLHCEWSDYLVLKESCTILPFSSTLGERRKESMELARKRRKTSAATQILSRRGRAYLHSCWWHLSRLTTLWWKLLCYQPMLSENLLLHDHPCMRSTSS